jgi:hypothetical protein
MTYRSPEPKGDIRSAYARIPLTQGVKAAFERLGTEGKWGAPFTRWVKNEEVEGLLEFYPGVYHPCYVPGIRQEFREPAFLCERDIFRDRYFDVRFDQVMIAYTPNDYLLVEVTWEGIAFSSTNFRLEELPTVPVKLPDIQ